MSRGVHHMCEVSFQVSMQDSRDLVSYGSFFPLGQGLDGCGSE
jgi:hypothetical protein